MASASWTDLPADVLAVLRRGAVLPAHPLALDEARKFDRYKTLDVASTGRCWSLPPRPHRAGPSVR